MDSVLIALISTCCVFGGALLGSALRKRLPSHHLDGDAKDTIKLGAAMITTLAALVLGLLVSSAKSSFDNINTGFTQAAAKAIQLDRTLAQYGPETAELRTQLRTAFAANIDMLWPKHPDDIISLSEMARTNRIELLQEKLHTLTPKSDSQRFLLAQAHQITADISLTRWLVVEQAHNELPTALVVMLIFWLSMLFLSFGLYAPRNPTVFVALFVCALSVSGALFLILELNHPLDGIIKISSTPMRKALDQLGH